MTPVSMTEELGREESKRGHGTIERIRRDLWRLGNVGDVILNYERVRGQEG